VATVPSAELYGTTVHVDPSTEDADLDRLLARLLRVMNPAAAPEAVIGGQAMAGGQAVADGQAGAAQPASEHIVPAETGFPAVSASEARALIELLTARGIAQGQLAALLGLEKSTVSRLAAGLERKGWLRRGRDEENQRFVRLYLTPEGRVIAARVWQAWQSRQARILATMSAEERQGLAAGLRGLVRGLAAEGLLEGAAAPEPSGAAPGTAPPGPPATPAPPAAPGAAAGAGPSEPQSGATRPAGTPPSRTASRAPSIKGL
jgi:DNA-binding MarR family transcriptional regulator